MAPKVAIEIFGQLRLWDKNNFDLLIKLFNDKGFEVDILGTFYNDEYTKKQDLSCFTKVQLINILETSKRYTLERYFYSLSQSYEQRKKYENETGVEYQFIVACRSDIHMRINEDTYDYFDRLIENTKHLPGPWINHQSVKAPNLDDTWFNDQIFICNDKTLEIFKDFYYDNKNVGDNNKQQVFRYHKSLGKIILVKGIKIIKYIDGLPLTPLLIRNSIISDKNLTKDQSEIIRDKVKDIQCIDELNQLIVDISN